MSEEVFLKLYDECLLKAKKYNSAELNMNKLYDKLINAIYLINTQDFSLSSKIKALFEIYKFEIFAEEVFIDPRMEERSKIQLFSRIELCNSEEELGQCLTELHRVNDLLLENINNHIKFLNERINLNNIY